jgi:hypothetical protein
MSTKRKAIRGPRRGNKTLQPRLLNDPVGGLSRLRPSSCASERARGVE